MEKIGFILCFLSFGSVLILGIIMIISMIDGRDSSDFWKRRRALLLFHPQIHNIFFFLVTGTIGVLFLLKNWKLFLFVPLVALLFVIISLLLNNWFPTCYQKQPEKDQRKVKN